MVTRADILFVRSLADKRARREAGLFVVEGDRCVDELLAASAPVKRIFAAAGIAHLYPGAEVASEKELERMSSLRSPAGVIALVAIPHHELPEDTGLRGLALALDNVQDPGNVGTIVRLADWFGIEDILCSEATADAFSPKAVQATMGSIARVRVHYCSLAEALSCTDAPVYGTFTSGESIYASPLTRTGIIVMGNEGRGISAQVEKSVTRRISVPPYPAGGYTHGESLNVAIAAAVICSEFRRRG